MPNEGIVGDFVKGDLAERLDHVPEKEKPHTLLEEIEEQLKFYEEQVEYAKRMIALLKTNPAIQEFHDCVFERENLGRRGLSTGKIIRKDRY